MTFINSTWYDQEPKKRFCKTTISLGKYIPPPPVILVLDSCKSTLHPAARGLQLVGKQQREFASTHMKAPRTEPGSWSTKVRHQLCTVSCGGLSHQLLSGPLGWKWQGLSLPSRWSSTESQPSRKRVEGNHDWPTPLTSEGRPTNLFALLTPWRGTPRAPRA